MMQTHVSYAVVTNECVPYWLCSPVMEQLYHARQVPMEFPSYHPGASTKDAEGKEIVSPAKAQYKQEGAFVRSPYPDDCACTNLYWPFDTDRVDFSGMWVYPTELCFYAKTFLDLKEDRKCSFTVLTSGAVKLWIDGIEQLVFAPYESNIEQSTSFLVDLPAGLHEILVGCNDYGERNIQLKFGLRNTGPALSFLLPCEVDQTRLEAAQGFLKGLYFSRMSYEVSDLELLALQQAPFDMQLGISAADCKQELLWKQGMKMLRWCSVETLGLGDHMVCITTTIDSVVLSTQLFVEVYPDSYRVGQASSVAGRKQDYKEFVVSYQRKSTDMFIALLAQGTNAWHEYEDLLLQDLERVNRRSDCADFRAQRFAWILSRSADVLTQAQRSTIEAALLDFRYWYDEKGNDAMWFFSENHALAFHTAELLAGQLFADRRFSNSGLTGMEHRNKAKALLMTWFNKLLQYGYNEWNSANYIPVDMTSYFMLYELAEDAVIRSLAKRALDYTFELFAVMCHKGMLNGSSGRVYARDLLGSKVQTANGITYIAWGAAKPAFCSAALFFSISSYEPDNGLHKIAVWSDSSLFEDVRHQGTNRVQTYVCKNNMFILATSSSPREGGPGSQEHLFNCMVHDARFWINHPGELKIFGTRRPGYFTGNALTPKVSPFHSSAVVSYRFSRELEQYVEADFTQVIFPFAAFDEVRETEKSILARKGGVFVFITNMAGLQRSQVPSLTHLQRISKGLDATWYVRLSTQDQGDWASFCRHMEQLCIQEREHELLVDDWQWGSVSYPLLPYVTLQTINRRPR